MDRPNLFWALAWLRLHEYEDRRTQALALCTEIADRQIEARMPLLEGARGLLLPGWTCAECRCFHGEVRGKTGELVQGLIVHYRPESLGPSATAGITRKEFRTHCRSCGAPRP
jgi:hypothetical protein